MSAFEAQVVGGILRDGRDAFWKVADLLSPEDFTDPKMAGLYRQFRHAAANEDHPFDFILFGEEAEAGGVAAAWEVTNLASNSVGSFNIVAYAEKVREARLVRETKRICTLGAKSGDLQSVQTELGRLMESQPASAISITDATKSMLEAWMEKYNSGEVFTGIRTGFSRLDELTGGLQPGRIYGIGARAKMGKTMLAMNICANIAIDYQKPVAIWSLEMMADELTQRMVCAVGMVPSIYAQRPKLIDNDDTAWSRWVGAANTVQQAPIRICTRADVTIEQIEAQVRQLHAIGACDVACIDYLGLIRPPKADRHDLAIGFMTRRLKVLAKDLGIPVLLVFQLNRENEKGKVVSHPVASNAKDSGNIEQDLDVMLLLHRPSYYDKTAQKGLRLDLNLNRNGKTGLIHLEDRLDCCRFVDTGKEWVDAEPTKGRADDDL